MTATPFNQKTIDEFHAKNSRGVGPWGDNLLLMTSKGAAGGDITTPLVNRREGESYVVIASKGGAPDDPGWYTNVQANPEVDIEVPADGGTRHVTVRARVTTEPERSRLYAYMTEAWPAFADYTTKTDRVIPVVVLEPVD